MSWNRAVRLSSAAAVLVVAAACDDAATPTDPATRLEGARQVASGLNVVTLAHEVPGVGGFYLDGGVPTVYLTEGGDRSLAERVLARYGYAGSAVRVVRAEYTYEELERWFQRLSPEALAVPGAVFADNDESTNRVLVGVENEGAVAAVRNVAARLGVPEGALEVRIVEPIGFAATLRDRIDPRIGGIQIHFGMFLCTLGFNTTDAGVSSFMTNSHCTDRQGGVEGTIYYQPTSSVDPTSIGTEVEDPEYQRNIPGCPRGRRCRHSDAARAAYNSGINFTLGEIARTSGTNDGSLDIVGAFTITGEDLRDNFTIGETVNKVGRTTGWTSGTVSNTCVTVSVQGSNVAQICQTIVESSQQIVAGGDSGSNVFRDDGGGNVTLYGILWGGNSSGTLFVFSPLKNIEMELGDQTTH